MDKFVKIERRSLKSIQIALFCLLVFVLVFYAGTFYYLDKDNDRSSLLLGLAISFYSIVLTGTVYVIQGFSELANNHRLVGEGNLPSKTVDKRIFEMYVSIVNEKGIEQRLEKALSFTTKPKHAQQLVTQIGASCFTFDEDVFKQTHVCTFVHKSERYEAISATKEMAICMAIKKAYDSGLTKLSETTVPENNISIDNQQSPKVNADELLADLCESLLAMQEYWDKAPFAEQVRLYQKYPFKQSIDEMSKEAVEWKKYYSYIREDAKNGKDEI